MGIILDGIFNYDYQPVLHISTSGERVLMLGTLYVPSLTARRKLALWN
jgi:hypothetical protein